MTHHHLASGRLASMPLRRRLASLVLSLLAASTGTAQTVVSASPDVTIALGSTDQVTADQDVAVENGAGFALLENVGSLPIPADVIAYGQELGGDRLLVLDVSVELPGGLIAGRGDVVRYDGGGYSTVFDASANGVPNGAIVDAVSIAPVGLLLSFDTTVDLPGEVAEDEDLVRWNGAGYALVFDGSAQGVDRALDVDGAQDLGGGAFLMSFDTSGEVGGVAFDDEDVLRFDATGWALEYDASAFDARWRGADLDAVLVPEPGFAVGAATGALAVGAARRRRRRIGRGR